MVLDVMFDLHFPSIFILYCSHGVKTTHEGIQRWVINGCDEDTLTD
jgi:hypothetical protein